MTAMTVHTSQSRPDDNPSYKAGHLDGELAALTGLSSRRAHARAAMARPYDPAYADGYLDGFDHQTDINAHIRFNQIVNAFHNGQTESTR